VVLRTRTDGLAITNQLTKNPYFDNTPLSPIGHDGAQEKSFAEQNIGQTKSLQTAGLGTEKELMSPNGNGSNPNTPDRIRTCDLRIRNPFRAFVSIVTKMVYTCQIKTYDADRNVTEA
jgi:hypothetical protein